MSDPGLRPTVALAAAVQFVILLDAALILPLGPDLAEPLAIPAASLGLLVAVYTGAAAISGVLAARVLDRFEPRVGMFVMLLGLSLAGVAAALAQSFAALMAARLLAGVFAAPTSALVMSLIADEIPDETRGRALGVVLSANALAGVLGVPGCLWLAEWIAWWVAFAAVAAVALLVGLGVGLSARAARARRPSRSEAEPSLPASTPTQRALHRQAHAVVLIAFAATFALTPNLSAYVQLNLGYPRSDIPLLYMVAGGCAFVVMHLSGRAVDRFGAALVGSVAIAGLAITLALFLAVPRPLLAIEPAFVLMLAALGSRNVALRTLTTRIPDARQRGRFMALQSTAQQLGAVAGVGLAMAMLADQPDGALTGMQSLARCSIVLLALVIPMLWLLERRRS